VGTRPGRARGGSIRTLQNTGVLQKSRQQHEIFDDFFWYVTAHTWTSLAADTNAAVAATDAAGGVLSISTGDATDNNQAGVFTTNESFKFAADAPLFGEAKIQYSEHNTNAANVVFGFADAATTDFVADNGASIAAGSAVLIYKLDGTTVWSCHLECNGTTVTGTSTTTAGGSAYQTLAIEVMAVDGTNVEATFYCDGQPLRDSNNRPIKLRVAYASSTEMDFGVYGKAGGGSTHTILVDYLYAAQRRVN
jgi:hypothetical protein